MRSLSPDCSWAPGWWRGMDYSMLWWGKLHQIWAGRHLTNLPAWKRWMAKPHRWPSPPSRVPGQIHPTTLRPLLQLQWLILAGARYHLWTVEEDNQFGLCFPAYSHQHCKQMTLPAVFSLANNNHKSLDCSGFFPFSISTKSYLSGFASDRSTTLSLLQGQTRGGGRGCCHLHWLQGQPRALDPV